MSEIFIHMSLREIQTSDDPRDLPIVVLVDSEGSREFPIFIGHLEGRALEEAALNDMASASLMFRRPMTHDLILNVITGLKAEIRRVLVTKLENGTFFGALELQVGNGEVVRIDSRPSDAMVLAVKKNIPIFVEEKVLAEVERGNFDKPE